MCEAESETDILWGCEKVGGDRSGVSFWERSSGPSEKCKEGARRVRRERRRGGVGEE